MSGRDRSRPGAKQRGVGGPLVPEMVAIVGLEELHVTGPSTSSPFTKALNCRLELLSCRGLLGEMVNLLAATQGTVKTTAIVSHQVSF